MSAAAGGRGPGRGTPPSVRAFALPRAGLEWAAAAGAGEGGRRAGPWSGCPGPGERAFRARGRRRQAEARRSHAGAPLGPLVGVGRRRLLPCPSGALLINCAVLSARGVEPGPSCICRRGARPEPRGPGRRRGLQETRQQVRGAAAAAPGEAVGHGPRVLGRRSEPGTAPRRRGHPLGDFGETQWARTGALGDSSVQPDFCFGGVEASCSDIIVITLTPSM